MTNPEGILRAARALLAKRGGWTQHAQARRSHGEPTLSEDLDATRFSLIGAVDRFMHDTPLPEAKRVWAAIDGAVGTHTGYSEGIGEWNDKPKRRKREVLAVIDEAIAKVT